jgi:predicted transcriptional regulator
MTVKQRIISFLRNHPDGIGDDELAKVLGLSARQQENRHSRELEKEGLVIRRQVGGKIHNFWANKDIATSVVPSHSEKFQNNLPKYEH